MKTILALQRTAFLRDGSPSLAQRRADLNNLKSAMLARRNAIEDAINADFGHHSRHEAAIMEVIGVVEGIKYLHRNLSTFMHPTRRHVALHMRFGTARVEYQPLGVVGIMSPWNYPVNLSMMPVVTAIAAGNRVMLKPSEFTPVLAQLIRVAAKFVGDPALLRRRVPAAGRHVNGDVVIQHPRFRTLGRWGALYGACWTKSLTDSSDR